jgi:hypothetical protein
MIGIKPITGLLLEVALCFLQDILADQKFELLTDGQPQQVTSKSGGRVGSGK